MAAGAEGEHPEALTHERLELLEQVEGWLEKPVVVLGLLWLALLVVELIWGLTPVLEAAGTVIWIIFIADFLLRFVLAPDKTAFLRRNWLTALSLLVPALRLFRLARVARALRAARATRGLSLFKVVSALNRGMRGLGASMGRRGFGYVITVTLLVLPAAAAGMYALEREAAAEGQGLATYGDALWWTVMLMTTIGSEYWPQTPEGRVLCVLLSIYTIAVFGYITAALATYFIGRDAASGEADLAGQASIDALRQEIAALRAELRSSLARETGDTSV